jgi:hypothetical protein
MRALLVLVLAASTACLPSVGLFAVDLLGCPRGDPQEVVCEAAKIGAREALTDPPEPQQYCGENRQPGEICPSQEPNPR